MTLFNFAHFLGAMTVLMLLSSCNFPKKNEVFRDSRNSVHIVGIGSKEPDSNVGNVEYYFEKRFHRCRINYPVSKIFWRNDYSVFVVFNRWAVVKGNSSKLSSVASEDDRYYPKFSGREVWLVPNEGVPISTWLDNLCGVDIYEIHIPVRTIYSSSPHRDNKISISERAPSWLW